ncbi:hypothetical protein LCM20_15510 [Halobacillus litoralis]|uniref:hypothetical protein n=1 Tax=Halobacillus litoralis TaxID=45668 RepID=UPI001CD1EF97|nr:hypothetical protein [Halobacillus litoralis]MCA0972013.1 hypothetical protein [Halobacillus litoralis]
MKSFNWVFPLGIAVGLFLGGLFFGGVVQALITAAAGFAATLLLSWILYKKSSA